MMMSPYLSFKGQCEAAFKFYEETSGVSSGPSSVTPGLPWRTRFQPTGRTKSCTAASHSATRS